jgi:hypothetical protein
VEKDRSFGHQDHQTGRVNVKIDVYGCIGQHNCTFLSSNSRGAENVSIRDGHVLRQARCARGQVH